MQQQLEVSTLSGAKLHRAAPLALLGVCLTIGITGAWLLASANGDPLNIFGAGIVTAVLYLSAIFTVSLATEGRRQAVNRLMTGLVACSFLLAVAPLISVGTEVIKLGSARFDLEFLTTSMRNIIGSGGGALHALVGTLLITLAATLMAVPLGLMTAIYLVEYGRGRLAKTITFLVDVMIGIPSIVAGLFAFALFALLFGPGVRLGISSAVSLAVLMAPVVIKSSEEMLRLVPKELREASYALGVTKWLTIVKIVLPTAITGITTGIMLAIARIIGETAPLIITAGTTASLNPNLFHGRMQTIPVFVFTQYTNQGNPASAFIDRAWAGALTLIIIVMLLNLLARVISKRFAPHGQK
ncbi:phosphate ABC transporter permease PstA [Canibacter sp. lx-45]|uniref:phosphate ABC transporter permease PstA n=1 Tax=Canibacter zhuwentaonis TaxID=2837491 RepID=UPI001BDD7314|nr:phosphate ABC transporter permease PstA [Canibacter zhuwentaonis]MBT1035306.1 phosphate ABC transporter permease PstA [Canibacter zhuwentaonis]